MRARDVVRAAAEARQLDTLTPADLVVLWDLADRAGRSGRAYESARAIADRYGWHYRTVRRAFQRIEATGIVRVERRAGRAPIVSFPVAPVVHNPASSGAHPRTDVRTRVVHNPAPIGAHRTDVCPAPMSPDPAPMSPRPRADERAVTEEQVRTHATGCPHRWRSAETLLCPQCEALEA